MLNILKRLRRASESGSCVSEMITPDLANTIFLDALDDDNIDMILFGDWFITIITGLKRLIVKFSSLKIKHFEVTKEKAEGFFGLYGAENCLEALRSYKEGKKISLSVVRKLSQIASLFSNPLEWELVATDESENFSVTTFRNKSTDEYEIVIYKFVKGR